MKAYNLIKNALLVLTLFLNFGLLAGDTTIVIKYFFQPGCAECKKVKEKILPELDNRYHGLYRIQEYDTVKKENFLQLVAYQDKLKITANEPVYVLVNKHYILSGYKEISGKIFDIMDELISVEQDNVPESVPAPASESILQKRADSFKVGTIIVAGLIDGINPCVFSTLVFFLSLLAVAGIKGRRLLLTGTIYCVACFSTYLLLGIGLFRVLKLFKGYHYLQFFLNSAMIFLLMVFAVLSFRDAWRYHVSGKPSSITMKLPTALQNRIHAVMRKGLSYKYLLPGAFFIGVLVTLLESVCTGQVYVPTLTLMAQDSGIFSKWVLYLILYNVMFTVPLVIIVIAAYNGIKTFDLVNWSKRSLATAKILLGLFFILMAAFLFLLL